jgi:hypothetical protein
MVASDDGGGPRIGKFGGLWVHDLADVSSSANTVPSRGVGRHDTKWRGLDGGIVIGIIQSYQLLLFIQHNLVSLRSNMCVVQGCSC